MDYSVSETAKICGVSVRTLQYYDQIGLVHPASVTPAGYRRYDDESLSRLQQVLFYKELGIPLKQISKILESPDHDKIESLKAHRHLLLIKRKQLDALIEAAEAAIGGKIMGKSISDAAKEYENTKKKYADEVKKRWGNTEEYAQSQSKVYTDKDKDDMTSDMEDIFRKFAENAKCDPTGDKIQSLVKRWQAHITKYHYTCSDEVLSGLGEMYTGDERFAEYLNGFGGGTAEIMSKGIKAYINKR